MKIMRRRPDLRTSGHLLPEATAVLVCVAAISAILGWRFGLTMLLPSLGSGRMPPDTASLFLLSGVSVIFMERWNSDRVQLLFGSLIFASGANILLFRAGQAPYWFGRILFGLTGLPTLVARPHATNAAAVGFCIWSVGTFILHKQPRTERQQLIVAVCGTVVIALGSLNLLNLSFGLHHRQGDLFSKQMVQLSGEAAILFCIIGFALCVAAKRQAERIRTGGNFSVVLTNHVLASLTLMLLFTGLNAVLSLGLAESSKLKDDIARTYHREKLLGDIVAGLREAESGQRGYLLTLHQAFLDAYWSGLQRVTKAQGQQTLDRSGDSGEFRALVQAKTEELAMTIHLGQAGRLDEAKAFVLTGQGVELMRRIEEHAAKSRIGSTSLIRAQNGDYKRAIDLVRRTVLASYAVALGLLGCAALFFRREIRARTRIEEKLLEHEAELALGIEEKTAKLSASEARYRAMLDQSPLAIHVLDLEGNSVRVNAAFERMVGVPAEAMEGYNIWADPQPDAQGTRELLRRTFAGEIVTTGTVRHVPKLSSGTPLGVDSSKATWAEVIAYPVKSVLGIVEEVVLLCQDVTDREVALLSVRESESKFRQLANVLPDVVWTAKADGIIDYCNDRWWTLTQGSPEAGMGWEAVVHPDDLQGCIEHWSGSVREVALYEREMRLLDRATGEYRWFLARGVPVLDEDGLVMRWVGATTDIQERKAAEEDLEQRVFTRTAELQRSNKLLQSREEELSRSLGERDVLFREVHHRVKNNLQVISSLLRMKCDALKNDPAARIALEESRRRVLSMSMIHERLYTNPNVNNIDFAEYTKSLVDELIYSYGQPGCMVRSRIQVEPIRLEVNQAIPCGLILNELVTNALKYAFIGRQSGEICVALRRLADGEVSLSISDNGIGLPPGINWKKSKSLGLPIVDILARQLEGSVEYLTGAGATFVIRFPAGGGRDEP